MRALKMYFRLISIIALSIAFTPPPADAASVRGKIASNKIKHFIDFVVYIKHVDPKRFDHQPKSLISYQKGFKVAPAILPLIHGSDVTFVNKDPEFHNINTGYGGPKNFSIGIPPGKDFTQVHFWRQGIVRLSCNIHPEMEGHILVLQNPFFATVSGNGRFTIDGIPPGSYELVTWHKDYKSLTKSIVIENQSVAKLVRFKY